VGAVADGEDGNPGSAEVFEGFDGMVDGDLRQQARAGIENMNFTHIMNFYLFLVLNFNLKLKRSKDRK